ncbi:carbohydrate porin [Rosenbergiella australiborealis]|uniref:carbohydrate porin n=1 Tax=Rosenbergiella australiborealis TaxID=1544696 RepID=UPI001F4E0B99|nr:carbohydrate porin [Rosenbergiella australiborealis]
MDVKSLYSWLLLAGITVSGSLSAAPFNPTVLGFEAPPKEGMFGDMLGLRHRLEDSGLQFNLGYLSQIATNMHGGADTRRKVAYIDQFAFTFTQDLSTLTGIPGAVIEGNIVNRNHNSNLATQRLQASSVPMTDLAQESWGGQSITRLGWFTAGRSFFDNQLFWRIGLMNKVQVFDQGIPCDFQILSLCGGKSAYSMTWNNWNVHTWGTSAEWKFTPELAVKVALMEQNPQAASRAHAWSVSTQHSKGVILPVEVEWRPLVNQLPGIYNLGVSWTNAEQTHLARGVNQYWGASDPQGYAKTHNSYYLWAGANQQVTKHADDPLRGISLSASLGIGDKKTLRLPFVSSVSARYRGPFSLRPNDWLGLGVSYVKVGKWANKDQLQMQEIAGGQSSLDYWPTGSSAINTELFYRLQVTPWFQLQPSVQYWHNPGAISETDDAWVLGLKTVVTF